MIKMNKPNHATTDHWIETVRGKLFARRWQPPAVTDRHKYSPIVLFHDSLGCIQLWRSFPAALAKHTGRPVIAYDRLGFGQSDPHPQTLDIGFIQEEATAFFPELLKHFAINQFVAFGHSVGGGMAVHCAARYASACEALITESAQAFVEDKTRAGIIEAKALFYQGKAFERLQVYHGEKTRWVLDAWIDTWLSPAFSNWSLNEILPLVKCPILVIHGSEDEYGSTRHPERITSLVSGPAQLEIVAGGRHRPHREQENWLLKRITRFLNK